MKYFIRTLVLALAVPLYVQAASQISYMSFDNTHVDTYGFMTTENSQYGTFVPGYSGQCFRSSHAGDDGSGTADYVIKTASSSGPWPASGELYIKFYYMFESSYELTSTNVKWLRGNSTNPYIQTICRTLTDTSISFLHYWGPIPDVGFDCGTDLGKYPGASGQTFRGTWMKVELYFKLSSGDNYDNCDGISWLKIDGTLIYEYTNIKTGQPTGWASPSINAISNQESGKGWWRIDEMEIWDGDPEVTDTTPPYAAEWDPEKSATGIDKGTSIAFQALDDGDGVDIDTIETEVEGVTYCWESLSGDCDGGSGVKSLVITGTPPNYNVTLTLNEFSYDQVVNVTNSFDDLAENNFQESYSFTIESAPTASPKMSYGSTFSGGVAK